ncbi:hypothetical protein E0L93_09080 [Rubrobacter taiwanensis]|uniref:Uncharacterized protein n=1 Tax=Rubrobacter taiwanensis TaxID=185139 RepID=A0A4R1BI34_9ACTN|nr:hypothetical protein [Rubrobacter taiwanensis]TCJ16857.1 hypothetical protein E0L93_09080 [Rubrobacter taiwanensis]
MLEELRGNIRWKAVVSGWIVAILTGIVVNAAFWIAHRWLFVGTPPEYDTTALITISLISGFLAHFVGGYVAGRKSGVAGGLNGAMVALLGTAALVFSVVLIPAIIIATAGAILVGGIEVPAVTDEFARGLLLTLLALFLLNLAGGFSGGRLGEWEFHPTRKRGR